MPLLKTSQFLVGLLYRLLSRNNVNNDLFSWIFSRTRGRFLLGHLTDNEIIVKPSYKPVLLRWLVPTFRI